MPIASVNGSLPEALTAGSLGLSSSTVSLHNGAVSEGPGSVWVGSTGIGLAECFGREAGNNYEAWFQSARVSYVQAARTAIYKAFSVLKLRRGDEVLVPSYNCGSEVDALVHAGANVRLFRVGRNGEIDTGDLASRITNATRAVYVIHYFGFAQRLGPIVELCRKRELLLIEDCALSALTEVEGRRLGCLGDVAVYNFPKVLPVPDGGALVINNQEFQPVPWSLRGPGVRCALANALWLLKTSLVRALPERGRAFLLRLRSSRAPGGSHTRQSRPPMPGSYYYDETMSDRRISRISERIMRRTDLVEVRRLRRQNFLTLLKRLTGVTGLEPLYSELPAGACPLYFPVLVERPQEMAARLRALSIPAISWWSGYHQGALDWESFPEACYLKDHLLAVPTHHQLSAEAVDFIAHSVRECLVTTARPTEEYV